MLEGELTAVLAIDQNALLLLLLIAEMRYLHSLLRAIHLLGTQNVRNIQEEPGYKLLHWLL